MHHDTIIGIPEGCQPAPIEPFRFVFNSGLFQQLYQLFARRFPPMVLFLIRKALLDTLPGIRADRKRTKTFLPGEFAKTDFVVDPN